MFAKFIVALSTFALFATAIPTAPAGSVAVNQCNTGSSQCCLQAADAQSTQAASLAGTLGVNIQGLTGLLGFGCSPLQVVGVNLANCAQTPVCCSGNEFNGLVNVGCVPISA